MTDYNREDLIEEAAKEIDPGAWHGGVALDPSWAGEAEHRRIAARRQAHSAFAVFEQAHAPSSDERVPGVAEREKRAARAWEFFTRDDRDMSHDFRGGYHQGMIDSFRRPEVPQPQAEPTDEQVEGAYRAWREASVKLPAMPHAVAERAWMRAALSAAFKAEGEGR